MTERPQPAPCPQRELAALLEFDGFARSCGIVSKERRGMIALLRNLVARRVRSVDASSPRRFRAGTAS